MSDSQEISESYISNLTHTSKATVNIDLDVVDELISFVERTLETRLSKIGKLMKKNNLELLKCKKKVKKAEKIVTSIRDEETAKAGYRSISQEISGFFNRFKGGKVEESKSKIKKAPLRRSITPKIPKNQQNQKRNSVVKNTAENNKYNGSRIPRSRRVTKKGEKTWDRLYNLGVRRYKSRNKKVQRKDNQVWSPPSPSTKSKSLTPRQAGAQVEVFPPVLGRSESSDSGGSSSSLPALQEISQVPSSNRGTLRSDRIWQDLEAEKNKIASLLEKMLGHQQDKENLHQIP